MKCALVDACPFFKGKMSASLDITERLKDVYCHGNHTICARHMIMRAVGREHIPDDIAPNHTHLVPSVIERAISQ